MTTTIITPGGVFTLDAVTSESHSSPLRVTDNPIESGSTLSDNAVLMPRPFEVTGVMVDFNPDDTPFNKLAEKYQIKRPNFIDTIPIPATLKSITEQTVIFVNRSIDLVAAAASQTVGGATGQRALAQWLPNLLPVDVSDLSVSDKRVADAYAMLRSIQQSAIPVQITTDTTSYSQALILDVRVKVSQEGSATFTLPCREIFISTTQTASGVKIGTTGGRTAAQTAKPQDKGEVTLPKVDLGIPSEAGSDADERVG